MADDQTLLARRRFAVVAGDDLAVGASDAERQSVHEHGTVALRWGCYLLETDGMGPAGLNSQRAHGDSLRASPLN
jgi:hypothetical protein